MKLIPIDPNNLPECEVLCISDDNYVRIGHLVLESDIVYCTGQNTTICDVTHYLPLDQIKPESDKPSLLDALPNGWIIQKHSNRLTVYENDRAFEDGINYENQLMIESIKDFEERMIDELT